MLLSEVGELLFCSEQSQEDKLFLSPKKRLHFKTHERSFRHQKYGHGSRHGPKPKKTVLSKDRSLASSYQSLSDGVTLPTAWNNSITNVLSLIRASACKYAIVPCRHRWHGLREGKLPWPNCSNSWFCIAVPLQQYTYRDIHLSCFNIKERKQDVREKDK